MDEDKDVTSRGEIEEEYIDRLAETWPEAYYLLRE